MQVIITARHFKAHDTIKDFIKAELGKLEKFSEHVLKAEVILSYEKPTNSVKIAEIIVSSNHHHRFTAKESTDDFKVSIESAVSKIASQLHKYKDKITSHHNSPPE